MSLQRWARPPGWAFHVALVPPTLALLWSYTWPDGHLWWWVASALVLGLASVLWGARLVASLRSSEKSTSRTMFGVAPVAGVVVAALILTGTPLQTRWSTSRSAFDDARIEALGENGAHMTGRRIGSYDVSSIVVDDDAVLFYLRDGGPLCCSGFAHVPDSLSAELVAAERPELHHLDGDWYWFTSSS